jgi:ABC-type branched-subunit amino acid transport system ATPase component
LKRDGNVTAVVEVSDLSVGYEGVRFSAERRGFAGLFGFRRHFFPILNALSFRICLSGTGAAIVGQNGIGKTTLLRALSGMIPARGTIIYNGRSLIQHTVRERTQHSIMYIPHENGLFPNLSVQEHLRLMAADHASVPFVIDRFFSDVEAVNRCFVDSIDFLRRDQKASNLSGGQKKLLSLIRLLLKPASLALVDEPTAGLSPVYIDICTILLAMLPCTTLFVAEQYSKISIIQSWNMTIYELSDGVVTQLKEE